MSDFLKRHTQIDQANPDQWRTVSSVCGSHGGACLPRQVSPVF